MPCWNFHGFEIPGIGSIFILQRFTIIYEVVASSRHPQTGGVSFQTVLSDVKSELFHVDQKKFDSWLVPRGSELDKYKVQTYWSCVFLSFFTEIVGVVILGFGNPWSTHDQHVIYPWLPMISPRKSWVKGKNRDFPNPWSTRDQPMIYPWLPVIFQQENHGFSRPQYEHLGNIFLILFWWIGTTNEVWN